MKFVAVVILVFVVVSAVCADLYRGRAQPNYTVVNQNDDYELRRYAESSWARTQISSARYSEHLNVHAFRILNSYFGGVAREGNAIEMTVPVVTTVEPSDCAMCNITFTMYFFMPQDVAVSAPQPSNPRIVQLVTMPEMQVYVSRFGGGLQTGDDWLVRGSGLHDALNRDGVEDDELVLDQFYRVHYDSPWRLTDRRNEVWILKYEAKEEQPGAE